MQPVILDMDPGVDDALAIILALRSPELDVLGISIVGIINSSNLNDDDMKVPMKTIRLFRH